MRTGYVVVINKVCCCNSDLVISKAMVWLVLGRVIVMRLRILNLWGRKGGGSVYENFSGVLFGRMIGIKYVRVVGVRV